MTQEDYCDFETSKLLKEKGFDRYPLFPCYKVDNGEFIDIPTTLDTINYCFIPAPTLQMAMKWLREVHNIYIEVSISCDREDKNAKIFDASIFNIQNQRYKKFCNIQGYEQACENSIKYCLENLI